RSVLACGVDGYARVCRLGHRERFDVIYANAAELELVAVGVVEGQKHARAPRRRVPRVSGRLERDAGGERGANLSQRHASVQCPAAVLGDEGDTPVPSERDGLRVAGHDTLTDQVPLRVTVHQV